MESKINIQVRKETRQIKDQALILPTKILRMVNERNGDLNGSLFSLVWVRNYELDIYWHLKCKLAFIRYHNLRVADDLKQM